MKVNVTQSLRLCALAAGVLLAGCSATHVGESWQCPLAQGSSCANIAEVDPAVPAAGPRLSSIPNAFNHDNALPSLRYPEEIFRVFANS